MINSTTHFIYRIVCFRNGKCYIGQTVNPYRRKSAHFEALRGNYHVNTRMQYDFNQYGETSFYFEIIQEGIAEADIDSIEQEWISRDATQIIGYNISKGGKSGGNQKYFDKTPPTEFNALMKIIEDRDNGIFG